MWEECTAGWNGEGETVRVCMCGCVHMVREKATINGQKLLLGLTSNRRKESVTPLRKLSHTIDREGERSKVCIGVCYDDVTAIAVQSKQK